MKNIELRNEIFKRYIERPEVILAALLLKKHSWDIDSNTFQSYSSKAMGAELYGKITRMELLHINRGIEVLIRDGYVIQESDRIANGYMLNIIGLKENSKEGYMLVDQKYLYRIFQSEINTFKLSSLILFLVIQRYRANIYQKEYDFKFYIYGSKSLCEKSKLKYSKVKQNLKNLIKDKVIFSNEGNLINTRTKGYLKNYYCLYDDKELLLKYTKQIYSHQNIRNSKVNTKEKKMGGLIYYHICKNNGNFQPNDLCCAISYLNSSIKHNGLDCYKPVVEYCNNHNLDISAEIQDLNIPIEVKDLFSTSKNL